MRVGSAATNVQARAVSVRQVRCVTHLHTSGIPHEIVGLCLAMTVNSRRWLAFVFELATAGATWNTCRLIVMYSNLFLR